MQPFHLHLLMSLLCATFISASPAPSKVSFVIPSAKPKIKPGNALGEPTRPKPYDAQQRKKVTKSEVVYICGDREYTADQVQAAVAHGEKYKIHELVATQDEDGNVLNAYPKHFENHEKLNINSVFMKEFPIRRHGLYYGSSPGQDRVIYGERGLQAVITHDGASGSKNGFVNCEKIMKEHPSTATGKTDKQPTPTKSTFSKATATAKANKKAAKKLSCRGMTCQTPARQTPIKKPTKKTTKKTPANRAKGKSMKLTKKPTIKHTSKKTVKKTGKNTPKKATKKTTAKGSKRPIRKPTKKPTRKKAAKKPTRKAVAKTTRRRRQ